MEETETYLSRYRGVLLIVGVITTFIAHNYLQEAIMNLPDFDFGWSLALMEVAGVFFFTTFERIAVGEELFAHRAPLSSYVGLTMCLLTSSSLSNIALGYINYPTKVVFRSCKLIPTMVIAVMWNKKKIGVGSFAAAIAVCAGLLLFALADSKVLPNFSPFGILLVLGSVCADAVMPNFQERLMDMGVSRTELTFLTNMFTLFFLLILLASTGELFAVVRFGLNSTQALVYFSTYCILTYVAVMFHMSVVKEFGGVGAVLVGNSRKAVTVLLSFFLFPKPFTYLYAVGGILVLAGLIASVYLKEKRKPLGGGGKARASPPPPTWRQFSHASEHRTLETVSLINRTVETIPKDTGENI